MSGNCPEHGLYTERDVVILYGNFSDRIFFAAAKKRGSTGTECCQRRNPYTQAGNRSCRMSEKNTSK